jgi:hypothetical protein
MVPRIPEMDFISVINYDILRLGVS